MSTLNTTNIKHPSSGSNNIVLDSSARVGIGTTSPGALLHLSATAGNQELRFSDTTNTAMGRIYEANGLTIISETAHPIIFQTNAAERARIDSSGRLLVGTSTSITSGVDTKLEIIQSNAGSSAWVLIGSADTAPVSGDGIGLLRFYGKAGGTWEEAARIEARYDATPGSGDKPSRLVFSTTADGASSPTERMRLDSTGLIATFAATGVLALGSASGAGTTNTLITGLHSRTGTVAGGTTSFAVYTNGNVINTNGSYTAISDAKLKENIVDAGSQWDDFKAIQIRNWNFKAETGHETHRQIGPIAQELEAVCPGLVFETPDRDEDGNETGEVTKGVNQSVLYMKAVKALQEAMERIEQLETSNADLLARVTALESA